MIDRRGQARVSSAAPARTRLVGGAVLLALVLLIGACGSPATSTTESEPITSSPPGTVSTTTLETPDPDASTAPLSAPPAGLQLAGMNAPAPVTLAPVAADGSLAVPDDISELGWWVGSEPMGVQTGTTLIAGHIDSAVQGLGVFARLRALAAGDELTVLDGLGTSYRFRVSGIQQVVKAELPGELFDTTGERRLALVTCSGPFDSEARTYQDNLIVWAVPV